MNALSAILKKATTLFASLPGRKARSEQFSVGRDWAFSLVIALLVLCGSAGYASLLLFSHSTDEIVEEHTAPQKSTIRRDEIDAMIEAYEAKDAAFSVRVDALVEVSDPSL